MAGDFYLIIIMIIIYSLQSFYITGLMIIITWPCRGLHRWAYVHEGGYWKIEIAGWPAN